MPQFAASPVRNGAPVAATCPVMPTPTLIASTSSTEPGRVREVAAERDRCEVVPVAEVDAAVVVVDQLAELVRDRGGDLLDLEQAAELGRDAVQHLEVGDRPQVLTARSTAGPGRSLSSASKTTIRLFPRALAVIIAISAQAMSSRGLAACSGPMAIPIESVTGPAW